MLNLMLRFLLASNFFLKKKKKKKNTNPTPMGVLLDFPALGFYTMEIKGSDFDLFSNVFLTN